MTGNVLYPEDVTSGDLQEAIGSVSYCTLALYGLDIGDVEDAIYDIIRELRERGA